MNKYFINTGRLREGPFDAGQLLQHGLKKETLVWRDGYTDWLSAGDVPELADLLRNTAPVFKSFGMDTAIPVDYQKKETKDNWNAVFWTLILSALIVLTIWWIARNRTSYRDPIPENTAPQTIVHTI